MSILVGACADEAMADQEQSADDQAVTDSEDATATIANLRSTGGCSYPVTVDGTDYAPGLGSVDTAHDLVPEGQTITARIRYRLPGGKGTVRCGFNTAVELPNISFRIIDMIDDGSDMAAR